MSDWKEHIREERAKVAARTTNTVIIGGIVAIPTLFMFLNTFSHDYLFVNQTGQGRKMQAELIAEKTVCEIDEQLSLLDSNLGYLLYEEPVSFLGVEKPYSEFFPGEVRDDLTARLGQFRQNWLEKQEECGNIPEEYQIRYVLAETPEFKKWDKRQKVFALTPAFAGAVLMGVGAAYARRRYSQLDKLEEKNG